MYHMIVKRRLLQSLNGSIRATTSTLFLVSEPQSSIDLLASIAWGVSAQVPRHCVTGFNVCFDCFRICVRNAFNRGIRLALGYHCRR